MDISTIIEQLRGILSYLEAAHGDPQRGIEMYMGPGERLPDPVESIQIIHLAASIAAKESVC
ncbi:MAG: hypothetical protein ACXAEN_17505 [Candidatus Thorarchaeota archaeon]